MTIQWVGPAGDKMHPVLALSTVSVTPVILPEILFPSTVGHIPIELSRYFWYALQPRGAEVRSNLLDTSYLRLFIVVYKFLLR